MAFDFNIEVIEASFTIPVLVDFWASWCGPCKVLGPVLDELAQESKGQWKLVKVDTEQNQELASQYGIQSIPNVKLFFKGEVVNEFMGALPKSAIQNWLNEHLPNENKAYLIKLIEELNPSNARDNALNELIQFCEDHSELEEGAVVAGKFLSYQNPDQAIHLVQNIKMGSPYYSMAEDVRIMAQWIKESDENSENPLDRAAFLLKNFYFRASIELLIDSLLNTEYLNRDLIRKVGIAFFRSFDSHFDWIKSLRKKFDMYLS